MSKETPPYNQESYEFILSVTDGPASKGATLTWAERLSASRDTYREITEMIKQRRDSAKSPEEPQPTMLNM